MAAKLRAILRLSMGLLKNAHPSLFDADRTRTNENGSKKMEFFNRLSMSIEKKKKYVVSTPHLC